MKHTMRIRTPFLAFLLFFAPVFAEGGVLVTDYDIVNGRKNMPESLFADALEGDTGVAHAVRALLTGDQNAGREARAFMMRAGIEAVENLPEARGLFTDVSAARLYEVLVTLDLLPERALFTGMEAESLQRTLKQVLDHYRQREHFPWEDERWHLGSTALRLIAAEALYAFNFPGDIDADEYRRHALRYFERNLAGGSGPDGSWTVDSPGYTDEAVEYLVLAAKAFRNSGLQDVFSNPRFAAILVHETRIQPPVMSPLVAGAFMSVPAGATMIGENHGDAVMMAAPDIRNHNPEAASRLAWFWDVCGRPVSPLGVLFIDTAVQEDPPALGSMPAGGGVALFRNMGGTADETTVYVNYGPPAGTPDRDRHRHEDAGDFSFVWNGMPLIIHNGWSTDSCTNDLINRAPWRHSIVLPTEAGDTPIVPASLYRSSSTVRNITGTGAHPGDMFPDGINQFFSHDMLDYVVGEAGVSGRSIPPASHFRHVLFLKPDALLVWDEIESSFPIEWNIWFPGENAWSEGNVLHMNTRQNVDLQVHFAGDAELDVTTETFPEEITWDWPLVLRSEHGEGSVVVCTLGLFRNARTDSSGMRGAMLANLLEGAGSRGPVGLLTDNIHLVETAARLGVPYELLSFDGAGNIDLSHFGAIVTGGPTSAENDRTFLTYAWKFRDYIANGGHMVFFDNPGASWMSGSVMGEGVLPHDIAFGSCGVTIDSTGADLKLYDATMWTTPNIITADSLGSWLVDSLGPSGGLIGKRHVETLPVAWSDAWQVLASLPETFHPEPPDNPLFGSPSRVRVRHAASKDFFTLFLPRRIGEQAYLFDVKRTEPGFVSFANPTTTWEIKAGETIWTDANISVMVDSLGVRTCFAFDCTYMRVGAEIFQAARPMSIFYSETSRTCRIMSAANNVVSYSRAELRISAGEIEISDPFGRLRDTSVSRRSYLTALRVVDSRGTPLEKARVHGESRLMGVTGADGSLPIPWKDGPPTVRVTWRGYEAVTPLRPGAVEVTIPAR